MRKSASRRKVAKNQSNIDSTDIGNRDSFNLSKISNYQRVPNLPVITSIIKPMLRNVSQFDIRKNKKIKKIIKR